MKFRFLKFLLPVIILWTTPIFTQQTRFFIYEKNDKFSLAPWLRYNKTEGLFTGLSGRYLFNEHFFTEARAGYAMAGNFLRYKAGIQKTFSSENNEFFLRADYYNLTETNDPYVLPDWQNSVTSLLFKLDYYNFFRTRGSILTFGQNWNGIYKIQLFTGMRNFYSLQNKANLSLFDAGGDKINGKRQFAYNPPVAEGRDLYFGVDYDIDFRPSPTAFVNAWQLKGRYENSTLFHGIDKSDFSYQRMYLEFNRYQRLFTKQKTLLTLKIAAHQGVTRFKADSAGTTLLPQDQFLFDMGGYGSLRGYAYREFQDGNRSAILNWDYFFNGSFLPKTFLARIWGLGSIFKSADLMLFADAGYVWSVDHNKTLINFSRIGLSDLRADAGFGLAFTEWIRCEAAFPLRKGTETKRGDYTIYLRITPKF
jgi:hypothetical protein